MKHGNDWTLQHMNEKSKNETNKYHECHKQILKKKVPHRVIWKPGYFVLFKKRRRIDYIGPQKKKQNITVLQRWSGG